MDTNRIDIFTVHQILEIIEKSFGLDKFLELNTQAKDVMIETLHQALLNPGKELNRRRKQRYTTSVANIHNAGNELNCIN